MRQQSFLQACTLILTLVVMLALLLTVRLVQAESVTVRLDAAEAANGDDAEIPILVEAAPGIGAMHVELTYDPAVLEATSVDSGELLDDGTLLDFNIPEPGRIVFGFVTLGSVEGDGEVAVAKFKVLGEADDESPLNFENMEAWEGGENRFDILVTTEGSTFTVASGSSFPWWIVFVVLIALWLFGVFIWMKRRQKPAVAAVPVAAGSAASTLTIVPPTPSPAVTTAGSFCSTCGTALAAGALFCSKCGARTAP